MTADYPNFSKISVDGWYETPGRKTRFRVKEVWGELLIWTGKRAQNPKSEPNVRIMDADGALRTCMDLISSKGEVALGACTENQVPEPDTIEAVLRASSLGGALASYFPPVLERLGLIEIFTRERALYCRRSSEGCGKQPTLPGAAPP